MQNVVKVDGAAFDVGVSSIKRKARIPDGPNAATA